MPDLCLDCYLSAIGSHLRGVSQGRRDEELSEIRQHLEDLVAASRQEGLSDHDAVHAAINQFGSPDVVGKALSKTLEKRRARFWPPNRRGLVSMGVGFVGTFVLFSIFLDPHGYPRDVPIAGQNAWILALYMLLFLVAAIAAYYARAWPAMFIVPASMLMAWVIFDQLNSPELHENWGRTYLNRSGPFYDRLAQLIMHAIQLTPALVGAFLGNAVGIWRPDIRIRQLDQ